GYQIYAYTPAGALLAQGVGEVSQADDGRTIDVLFQLVPVTISGKVFAGDGVTPAPGVTVQLIDGNNLPIAPAMTAIDGSYTLTNVALTGGRAFKVVAKSPADPTVTAEASGTYAGTPMVVDLVLPVSIVTATVTYADGTQAVGNLRATHEDAE